MNYIFFDDSASDNLLPLTFTRPVAELRIGITTIREKWERELSAKISFITKDYLSEKFKLVEADDNILINGSIVPNDMLVNTVCALEPDSLLFAEDKIIAVRLGQDKLSTFSIDNLDGLKKTELSKDDFISVENPWDLFAMNDKVLRYDFEKITAGRESMPISETNRVIGAENIFIEEGAKVECAIINAETGPVYIGKDAEVMEGSIVRGPFALCDHSALKLGAKIYGATTIGPHSKVGGEVNNSVILGYSNKAHDGFLGNSVIGEWCNLGADSNNSNLKNNYAEVRLWNYPKQRFVHTGLQFCGLIMGDHSKCGINTMFNTGTVVGVSANIYGSGFPRNYVPSFSWGGAHGFVDFSIKKAFEVAGKVMARRGIDFDETEQNILTHIYNETTQHRK
ncbi:MAG: GlmU family protein [Bacteroidales bacterium]|nr:GlmU family protein [Bacteroidales bacterium]